MVFIAKSSVNFKVICKMSIYHFLGNPREEFMTTIYRYHWRIQGFARDSPGVQILSFSCSFRQKNGKTHPLWKLAPPTPPQSKILDASLVIMELIPPTPSRVRDSRKLIITNPQNGNRLGGV